MSLGTIEVGKIADLVLLDADPLADIRHTKRIAGVMLRGRYLDRKTLNALLEGVASDVRERRSRAPLSGARKRLGGGASVPREEQRK